MELRSRRKERKEERKLIYSREASLSPVEQLDFLEEAKPIGLLIDQVEFRRERRCQGVLKTIVGVSPQCIRLKAEKNLEVSQVTTKYRPRHCRQCNWVRLSSSGPQQFCRECKVVLVAELKRIKRVCEGGLRALKARGKSAESVDESLARLGETEAWGERDRELVRKLLKYFQDGVEQKEPVSKMQTYLSAIVGCVNISFQVKAERNDWDRIQQFTLMLEKIMTFKVVFNRTGCELSWLNDRSEGVLKDLFLILFETLKSRWNGIFQGA